MNSPIDGLSDAAFVCFSPSPEELLIGTIDALEEAERHRQRVETARRALDALTDVQRRRYLMHHIDGLSTWEIASREGVNQSKIMNSLALADKKIKKFLASSKNRGSKRPKKCVR